MAFGFGGYLAQSGTDELYAFARTYAPGMGRFNESDPVRSFNPMMAMGLHRYVLGYGNSLKYVDPDGRYGVFFDGTGNNGEFARHGEHTNVWKLQNLYSSGPKQYQTGIGTELRDGGTVLGKTSGFGFNRRIEQAYTRMVEDFNSDDSLALRKSNPKEWVRQYQIDVFGFSRGAAEARAFSNLIRERGIPDYSSPNGQRYEGYGANGRFVDTYENYGAKVRFMGIFDTVDARGLQISDPRMDDQRIDPNFVGQTLHMAAAHEYRPGFDLTSALPYPGANIANIDEIFCAGAHSDCGGSQLQAELFEAASNRYLSDNLQDIHLAIMVSKAKLSGVEFGAINAIDQFSSDPRTRTEQELWNEQIHDSRLLPESYVIPEIARRIWRAGMGYGDPFETLGRSARDVYYTNGERIQLNAKQLERLWRSRNGYGLVIKEAKESPEAEANVAQ